MFVNITWSHVSDKTKLFAIVKTTISTSAHSFFSLSFIIVPSKLNIKNRNTPSAIISTYLRKEKLDNMHHTYGKSKNQLISIFLSLGHIMSSPLLSLFYKMLKNIRNTPFFLLDWSTLALLFIIRYDHNMIISVEERASESDIYSR